MGRVADAVARITAGELEKVVLARDLLVTADVPLDPRRLLDRLRRRNERLAAELERTRTALEITGKVHALLEQLSESADTDPRSRP